MSPDDHRQPDLLPRGLRQTRRFRDQPVPQAVIDEMLAAGKEIGAVRLLVVDDLITRQELASFGSFSGTMTGVAVMLVVVRAETLVAVDDKSLGGRVADAMMRVAMRRGLGTGYGWFSGREDQRSVRELLAIPAGQRVLVVVGVGYIDDNPHPTDSSLTRVQATLTELAGNRNRASEDE